MKTPAADLSAAWPWPYRVRWRERNDAPGEWREARMNSKLLALDLMEWLDGTGVVVEMELCRRGHGKQQSAVAR